MKALSVKQPWAWLIAANYKDIENRRWATSFRGRIYIHAGLRFDNKSLRSAQVKTKGLLDEQAKMVVVDLARSWKTSAIIGEVDIVDCVTRSESPWFTGPYGFVLANPALYDEPIPCLGKTYFFEPDI